MPTPARMTRDEMQQLARMAGEAAADQHYRRALAACGGRSYGPWTCPECGETHDADGWTWREDPCPCQRAAARDAEAAKLAELRPQAIARHLELAAIPPRYAGATFANFERRAGAAAAYEACQEWAGAYELGQTSTGLYLAGPYGSGKTHLAVATLRAAIERALPHARFVGEAGLLARVRAGTERRVVDMAPVEEAARAELLVYDDLGQVGDATPFGRGVIYELVQARYEAGRPTIMTSNAGDVQLRERLGGALVSRLLEMCELVPLTATDYRAEIARRRRTDS